MLAQDEFRASEADGTMEVVVCKQQQIDSSVTVMISPLIVNNDTIAISEAVLSSIPPDVQQSPNRAG